MYRIPPQAHVFLAATTVYVGNDLVFPRHMRAWTLSACLGSQHAVQAALLAKLRYTSTAYSMESRRLVSSSGAEQLRIVHQCTDSPHSSYGQYRVAYSATSSVWGWESTAAWHKISIDRFLDDLAAVFITLSSSDVSKNSLLLTKTVIGV